MLLLLLGAVPVAAQNLLQNAGFDHDVSGWTFLTPGQGSTSWRSGDVAGAASSGSVNVVNGIPGGAGATGPYQCIPVQAGQRYDFGVWTILPPGQAIAGFTYPVVSWSSSPACSFGLPAISTSYPAVADMHHPPAETWLLVQALGVVAPPGSQSALVVLSVELHQAGGPLFGYFDDARFCRSGSCGLQIGPELSSPDFPDFRFKVTIEGGTTAFPGRLEADCLPGTVCVSGAIPGRTEVLLRVIGPRPNGFLWFQAVRFTPGRVVLEVRQLSSGTIRQYVVPAVGPDDLPGNLQDREAFSP